MNDINKVERMHGKEDKKIYCVIPLLLSKENIKIDETFNLNDFDQPQYGEFSLSGFLNRYLAGGNTLKDFRSVSRKRLALITSKIGYIDPQATELAFQIERYQKGKQLLLNASRITMDIILEINNIVDPSDKMVGSLRTNQNWIGGKTPSTANYVPPPPEFVINLMLDWLEFVNSSYLSRDAISILGHNQLLNIHPFRDANGRLARIFLQAELEKKYSEIVHPCLYRLNNNNNKTYIDAIRSTLNPSRLSQPMHCFWTSSLDWSDKTKQKMYQVLASGKSQLNSRLGMNYISGDGRKVLDYLWIQPIICEVGLQSRFNWSFAACQNVIQELVVAKVLEPRRLRSPDRAVIYDCSLIFNIWQELDDLVFE